MKLLTRTVKNFPQLRLRQGGEQVQGQVRGQPGHVGDERLDQRHRPSRVVPVVLQILPRAPLYRRRATG